MKFQQVIKTLLENLCRTAQRGRTIYSVPHTNDPKCEEFRIQNMVVMVLQNV